MIVNGSSDFVLCRCFPSYLDGPTLDWFYSLPANSISCFRELEKLFEEHFAGSAIYLHDSDYLNTIKQGQNRSLKDYMTCFTKVAMSIPNLHPEKHGHTTDECVIPKDLLERLARQGHLDKHINGHIQRHNRFPTDNSLAGQHSRDKERGTSSHPDQPRELKKEHKERVRSERRGKSVAGGGFAPSPPLFVGPCYAVATIPSVTQPYPRCSASCQPFVEPRRASPLKPCHRRRSQRRETSPSQEQEEEGVAMPPVAVAVGLRENGGKEARDREDEKDPLLPLSTIAVVEATNIATVVIREPPLELSCHCRRCGFAPPLNPAKEEETERDGRGRGGTASTAAWVAMVQAAVFSDFCKFRHSEAVTVTDFLIVWNY
nr:uncharacterized protein LOC112757211 [Arachis hypogaea]